jgi:hypothetical protein
MRSLWLKPVLVSHISHRDRMPLRRGVPERPLRSYRRLRAPLLTQSSLFFSNNPVPSLISVKYISQNEIYHHSIVHARPFVAAVRVHRLLLAKNRDVLAWRSWSVEFDGGAGVGCEGWLVAERGEQAAVLVGLVEVPHVGGGECHEKGQGENLKKQEQKLEQSSFSGESVGLLVLRIKIQIVVC